MTRNKKYTFVTALMLLSGFSSVQAATIDGVIKGADCYLQSKTCVESKNDPHLALETDFVLVSGSEYYFLKNLSRNEKVNIYNDKIRIEGDVSGKEIDVQKVIRKNGNQEQVVWDWDAIYES